MASSWSISRKAAGLACCWLLLAAQRPARASAGESIRGRGLLAADGLFLFGDVHRCGGEPALPEAQAFVSTDGGQTWQKRGPALAGSEILFAAVRDHALVAAGQHTAEGPAVDPFVIAADGQAHTIAEGPGELVDVTLGTGPELTARVRRTGPHGEKQRGGPQSYVSHDGGRTWSAASGTAAGKGGTKLARVGSRSGPWRMVQRKDGGFDLQKRQGNAWLTVKPVPWTPCPG